jgi:hypothetical protein
MTRTEAEVLIDLAASTARGIRRLEATQPSSRLLRRLRRLADLVVADLEAEGLRVLPGIGRRPAA